MLTLGEAAKHTGVSKSTISRSVKAGRISATIDAFGVYRIDPAELFRVYPPATPATGGATGSVKPHAPPHETPAEKSADVFKAEIEGLRAQLAMMKDQNDELRSQRDGWQRQAENAQRLLVDQRPGKRGGLFGLFKAG